MTLPEAFFLPDGAGYAATELARGPWSRDHAHGGPPVALLARHIEAVPADAPMDVVRVTVDLLRPVPLARLDVATEVLRRSRSTQLVQAVLRAGDRELARATALRLRRGTVALPPLDTTGVPDFPSPDDSPAFQFPFFVEAVGYHTGIELRLARGPFGRGAAAAWFRLRRPIVAGTTPSPLERVLAAADSGNGVSLALDTRRFTFVNADLTVHLHRPPEGEWVALDARTTPEATGIGLAESALRDARGPIGRALQSLLVERRP